MHSNIDCVKPDHHMEVDLLSQKQRAWRRDQGKQHPAAIRKVQIVPRDILETPCRLPSRMLPALGSLIVTTYPREVAVMIPPFYRSLKNGEVK